MKVKTCSLIDAPLDWAVAKALGATDLRFDAVHCWWFTLNAEDRVLSRGWSTKQNWAPSVDWAQGGPIIEREEIYVRPTGDAAKWECYVWGKNFEDGIYQFIHQQIGLTPLIAAMRCYCCAKLGNEIEIPQELQPCQQPNL